MVFTAEEAKEWHERGEKVILVRLETSPEDIEGMQVSQGILTVRGGMTSHAAVVARGMGTCCVSGCGAIKMDEANKQFELAGRVYHEGDWLSLDGSTGNIYGEAIPTVDASIGGEFGRIMAWADKYRQMKVRTNADNPRDAKQAMKFGAEGIGLCRTEHMFFEADRIPAIREMICSDTVEQREKALEKLELMQQGDFEAMYEAMEGNPITIGGVVYDKGLGLHADSEAVYHLGGQYTRFQAVIGIDDEVGSNTADAIYRVYATVEGSEQEMLIYEKQMSNGMSEQVDLSVRGVTTLRLVTDANGSNSNDHTDWADAKLLGAMRNTTKAGASLTTAVATSTQGLEAGETFSAYITLKNSGSSALCHFPRPCMTAKGTCWICPSQKTELHVRVNKQRLRRYRSPLMYRWDMKHVSIFTIRTLWFFWLRRYMLAPRQKRQTARGQRSKRNAPIWPKTAIS